MSAPTRSALPWAVLAMEAAVVYPLLSSWLTGGGHVLLGPPCALALFVLGFVAGRPSAWRVVPFHRLEVGAAASLALRLLVTPRPAELSATSIANWIVGALLPAAVGLVLWWRGVTLAESEFTADGVRTEFSLAGAALLGLLTIFREIANIPPYVGMAAVVAFVASGLAAVGMARQEEAGLTTSANAGALVASAVLLLLGLSVGLVGLLSPEVVATLLAVVGEVVGFVAGLLLWPLVWLASLIQWRLPVPELETPPPINPLPIDPNDVIGLPDWLQQLITAAVVVIALLAVAFAAALLLWVLFALLQRTNLSAGGRAPVAVEAEGTPWQDAEALLAALRGWFGDLGGRARAARRGEHGAVADARAAYRALLRWAARRGVPRAPAETPAEYGRRLTRDLPAGAPHYALFTSTYERARYGSVAVPDADLTRLRQSLDALAHLPRESD